LAAPPVERPAIAKLLVALMPAPHPPVADTDNLDGCPSGDLLAERPKDHFYAFVAGSPRPSN